MGLFIVIALEKGSRTNEEEKLRRSQETNTDVWGVFFRKPGKISARKGQD